MIRFLIGLCFGVILTVSSAGFVGVGHGTYVPMVFTGSLIALFTAFGVIPVMALVPLLWALYFLLIPRFQTRRARIVSAAIVLLVHIVSGVSLAIEDPAFWRVLNKQLSQFLAFGFILALAMALLIYFAARGGNKTTPTTS
jgi:hypothetical protein